METKVNYGDEEKSDKINGVSFPVKEEIIRVMKLIHKAGERAGVIQERVKIRAEVLELIKKQRRIITPVTAYDMGFDDGIQDVLNKLTVEFKKKE